MRSGIIVPSGLAVHTDVLLRFTEKEVGLERKHLPDVDVAAAGGWAPINTMKRA